MKGHGNRGRELPREESSGAGAEVVGVSEARDSLSDLVRRVRATGRPVVVLKSNRPMAALVPASGTEGGGKELMGLYEARSRFHRVAAQVSLTGRAVVIGKRGMPQAMVVPCGDLASVVGRRDE